MILAERAEECCGCGACQTVCPKNAIAMKARPDGAVYPSIDGEACIDCGLCRKVCGYGTPPKTAWQQLAFAALGREEDRIAHSASGGVFVTLAAAVLASGGMAAGAVMDFGQGGVQVYHLLSDSEKDLRRMQGSKYVQSEVWRCYGDLRKALQAGKQVLFSGTPCQVAAVKAVTGNPENLVTIDLICHGVPPLAFFREFCGILERRFRGTLTNLCFRDKSVGKLFCARLDLEKHGKTRRAYLRSRFLSFYHYFLKGTIYRENCYQCPYASRSRVSDLTIGDYWGIEKAHEADFAAGIMPCRGDWSCLLVNTRKGAGFLAAQGEGLRLYPSRPEWIAASNQQLNAPSAKPEDRERLLAMYQKEGYAALEGAFVRASGGRLRYFWRLMKNLRENQGLRKK